MSVHVLMHLLNELRQKINAFLSIFRNKFNKFNSTGARMLDYNYRMTLKYF